MESISRTLTTFPPHLPHLLGAFAVYTIGYLYLSPLLSQHVASKTYPTLSPRTRANWDIRVVSQFQAIFICYCAFDVIWRDRGRRDMTRDERLWAYSYASGRIQAFAGGYFLWDILVSAQHLQMLGASSLIHACCAFGVTMSGFRPFANFYGINFVLYEISTPFLNIHWWLDKFGLTGSDLQLYNGICLMASFCGSRLIWGSYQTWKLSQDIFSAWSSHSVYNCGKAPITVAAKNTLNPDCGKDDFPATLLLSYLLANSMLSILNFYWFGKMIQALKKRLMPS